MGKKTMSKKNLATPTATKKKGPTKVANPKTQPTKESAEQYIETLQPDLKREDCKTLLSLFSKVTRLPPVMWGGSIIGFGKAPYTNTCGTGEWFLCGFAARANGFSLYPGLSYDGWRPIEPLLSKLGKHSRSVSCLSVKRLQDIDLEVLEKVVSEGFKTSKAKGGICGGHRGQKELKPEERVCDGNQATTAKPRSQSKRGLSSDEQDGERAQTEAKRQRTRSSRKAGKN